MSVTEKLLRLFRVDQQLGGLQARLHGAERFLDEQTRQLHQIEAKRDAVAAQLKQLQAVAANHEGEVARLDAKMAAIREQMNAAKTNKEYKAFLTEINTFKADRDRAEEAALTQMTKADELRAQQAELEKQRLERDKVRAIAAEDRDKRAEEIKDRVAELKKQREALAGEVPGEALRVYTDGFRKLGDEVMAHVDELDRRAHEYTCGSCNMIVTPQTLNQLLKGDIVTTCKCGSILYIEQEVAKGVHLAGSKR